MVLFLKGGHFLNRMGVAAASVWPISLVLGSLIWVLSFKQCDYWLEGRPGREREFKDRPVDLLFDQVSKIEFVRRPSGIKNDQFPGVVTNL